MKIRVKKQTDALESFKSKEQTKPIAIFNELINKRKKLTILTIINQNLSM